MLARPGYPAYRNILRGLGCEVIEIDTAATGYRIQLEDLEALHPRPAGLLIASPANPTGTVIPPDELAALVTWCSDNGVRLISDEIYHGITYGVQTTSALQFSSDVIAINSFSKFHCMTGWRVGWLVLPDDLVDPVDRLTGNMTICPPAISQYAALAAFDVVPELEALVHKYASNRTLTLDALSAMGIHDVAPADGAFYAYANISHLTDDSMSFVFDLLDKTGVAIAPGIDFDPIAGHHYVRLSYAGNPAEIAADLDAIANYVRGL